MEKGNLAHLAEYVKTEAGEGEGMYVDGVPETYRSVTVGSCFALSIYGSYHMTLHYVILCHIVIFG